MKAERAGIALTEAFQWGFYEPPGNCTTLLGICTVFGKFVGNWVDLSNARIYMYRYIQTDKSCMSWNCADRQPPVHFYEPPDDCK